MKTLLAASLFALATPAMAGPTTIDFTTLAHGTAVTKEYSGVVFSLGGGPDASGSPVTGPSNYPGLTNSKDGKYPTASILDVKFTGGADKVSFVFNNLGTREGGRGASFYQAFNKNGVELDIGGITGAFNKNLIVSGSNIVDLQFNNNTSGFNSWVFALDSVTFTSVSVPEPMTAAVFGVGLLGVAMARRRAA